MCIIPGVIFSIGWMFMIMIFPPPTDRSNIFYRKINADSILFSTMRMSAFFWTKKPESEEELDIGPDRNHGEAVYCCEESSSRS